MMERTAILVSLGVRNPDTEDDYEAYQIGARPLLEAAGATLIGAWRHIHTLTGSRDFETVFVAAFPSEQAIRDMWASEAYTSLVPARDRAFRVLDQFIAGAP